MGQIKHGDRTVRADQAKEPPPPHECMPCIFRGLELLLLLDT